MFCNILSCIPLRPGWNIFKGILNIQPVVVCGGCLKSIINRMQISLYSTKPDKLNSYKGTFSYTR